MKTLKFMLAAATAIGLASATQATQNTEASTGFEKLARGTRVITGVTDNNANSYFYYAGATADDNESVIAAAPDLTGAQRPTGVSRFTGDDLSSRANVLQVSTGTDPLLRTLQPLGGTQVNPELPAGVAVTKDIYVDTLVQFTVTPPTDEVVPSNGVDKLMLYLGANTNAAGEVVSKTLKVVGGFLNAQGAVVPDEYEVTNVSVDTNHWYRLTVQTIGDVSVDDQGESGNNGSFMGFKLYIDGTLCTLNKRTFDNTDSEENAAWEFVEPSIYYDAIDNKQVVLSLLATSSVASRNKLIAVGFAGEGYVDDLVVTTTDPEANVVDFTFDISGEGVGAVSFTVNGDTYSQGDTYEVPLNAEITVTAAAQNGYELIAPTTNGLAYVSGDFASATYTVIGPVTASLTINAQEAAASDWAADPTQIADNTPAATQYPALADSALATADAKKLTVWATDNNIDFSAIEGDTEGTYVEAYLLDCAVGEVEDEKDDFTLTITFDSEGNPVIESPVDRGEKTYNGTVIIKGSTTVNGTYENPAPSGAKFFKAELSL